MVPFSFIRINSHVNIYVCVCVCVFSYFIRFLLLIIFFCPSLSSKVPFYYLYQKLEEKLGNMNSLFYTSNAFQSFILVPRKKFLLLLGASSLRSTTLQLKKCSFQGRTRSLGKKSSSDAKSGALHIIFWATEFDKVSSATSV